MDLPRKPDAQPNADGRKNGAPSPPGGRPRELRGPGTGLSATEPFQPRDAPTPRDCSPPEADPEVPAELAEHPRYEVLEWLGTGGMGTVYKARHRLMNRLVALKVIKRALVTRPDMVERFHREVRAAAGLSHPNIVHAYDAEQAGDLHFLAMEFVEGTTLDQVLAQGRPLPAAQACDYARQAALGLQHAHDRGMVHRDIKPHNLMLTPRGQVKILDFGLARYVLEALPLAARDDGSPAAPAAAAQGAPAGPANEGLTATYSGIGTADYVAPEVVRDARHADIRADIYSLGCTLYQFLCGQVPFPGGTAADKAWAHVEASPAPLAVFRRDLPPGLAAVVEQMMARDPAARFQEPGDVAQALAPFCHAAGRHLLVVDDDPAMRAAVRLVLEHEGYTVSGAANGREALDYLRGHAAPAMVLLDLLMPVMDGWEFLRALHADPALAGIPVIVISAADAMQAKGAVLGAAAYLRKPVPLDELAAKVHRVEERSPTSPG